MLATAAIFCCSLFAAAQDATALVKKVKAKL